MSVPFHDAFIHKSNQEDNSFFLNIEIENQIKDIYS